VPNALATFVFSCAASSKWIEWQNISATNVFLSYKWIVRNFPVSGSIATPAICTLSRPWLWFQPTMYSEFSFLLIRSFRDNVSESTSIWKHMKSYSNINYKPWLWQCFLLIIRLNTDHGRYALSVLFLTVIVLKYGVFNLYRFLKVNSPHKWLVHLSIDIIYSDIFLIDEYWKKLSELWFLCNL